MSTYQGWTNYATWLVAYWFDRRRVHHWHALVEEQRSIFLDQVITAALEKFSGNGESDEQDFTKRLRHALWAHFEERAPDLPYADYEIIAGLALFSRQSGGQHYLARRLEAYFRGHGPDAPVMQGLASVNWREIAEHLIGVIHQVDWSYRDGGGETGLW
jgi:hypothetical protein